MTFYLPSDRAYQRAKHLKRGTARLDPFHDSFVAAFGERFGFPPLGIEVDTIERPGGAGTRPRLGVVLERTSQRRAFTTSAHPVADHDPVEQRAVAALFVDHTPGVDLGRLFGVPEPAAVSCSWWDEIFVHFLDGQLILLLHVVRTLPVGGDLTPGPSSGA